MPDTKIYIANHEHPYMSDGAYYFALSDYPRITAWELKKLLAFIEYEERYGRQTETVCQNDTVSAAVKNALARPETVADTPLPEKITECTYCRQNGCLTRFVCHTATIENAKKILECGKLLSAVKAFNKSANELVLDSRNAAGDPADYFDYIMFAWGNCIAGDRLVMERTLGRNPNEDDLAGINFNPGVRFYFRYEDIIKHPGFVFDGSHPAKVKDELVLSDYLYACVIPEKHREGFEFEFKHIIQPETADKIHYLPQEGFGLLDWAEKVYDFINYS